MTNEFLEYRPAENVSFELGPVSDHPHQYRKQQQPQSHGLGIVGLFSGIFAVAGNHPEYSEGRITRSEAECLALTAVGFEYDAIDPYLFAGAEGPTARLRMRRLRKSYEQNTREGLIGTAFQYGILTILQHDEAKLPLGIDEDKRHSYDLDSNIFHELVFYAAMGYDVRETGVMVGLSRDQTDYRRGELFGSWGVTNMSQAVTRAYLTGIPLTDEAIKTH